MVQHTRVLAARWSFGYWHRSIEYKSNDFLLHSWLWWCLSTAFLQWRSFSNMPQYLTYFTVRSTWGSSEQRPILIWKIGSLTPLSWFINILIIFALFTDYKCRVTLCRRIWANGSKFGALFNVSLMLFSLFRSDNWTSKISEVFSCKINGFHGNGTKSSKLILEMDLDMASISSKSIPVQPCSQAIKSKAIRKLLA